MIFRIVKRTLLEHLRLIGTGTSGTFIRFVNVKYLEIVFSSDMYKPLNLKVEYIIFIKMPIRLKRMLLTGLSRAVS